jgi:hypothetical protein
MTKGRAVLPRKSGCSMGADPPIAQDRIRNAPNETVRLRFPMDFLSKNIFRKEHPRSRDGKGEGGSSRAERLLNDNPPSALGWVAQVSLLRPGCSGRQIVRCRQKAVEGFAHRFRPTYAGADMGRPGGSVGPAAGLKGRPAVSHISRKTSEMWGTRRLSRG